MRALRLVKLGSGSQDLPIGKSSLGISSRCCGRTCPRNFGCQRLTLLGCQCRGLHVNSEMIRRAREEVEGKDFYPEKRWPPQVPCLQAPDEPSNSRGSGVSGSGSPGSFALGGKKVWPIPAGKLMRTAPNRNGVDSGGLSLLAPTPQRPDSSLRSGFPQCVHDGSAEDSPFARIFAQKLAFTRILRQNEATRFRRLPALCTTFHQLPVYHAVRLTTISQVQKSGAFSRTTPNCVTASRRRGLSG